MGEAAGRFGLRLVCILDCESSFVLQKELVELLPANYFLTFISRVKPGGLARCKVGFRCELVHCWCMMIFLV